MSEKNDWKYLFIESRARVYLLWAVLLTVGFIATHYYQQKTINGLWFTISLIGLGYMWKVMPLRVKQMKHIFLAWLIPIAFGMAVSGLIFYLETAAAFNLIGHLGAFWLLVMSLGYFLNGLVDPPSGWYWFAAVLNFVAGILCFTQETFEFTQYLIAAVVSAWSMVNLWLFRSSYL